MKSLILILFSFTLSICYSQSDISLLKCKEFPKAHKVISFGDRMIDMEASKAAGLISVACLWGSKEGEMLSISKPNYIVKRPIEAFKIINKYFL